MKWSISLALLWAALLAPPAAPADPVIYLNVSFKAILDPATGQPAPDMTAHLIDEVFRFANLKLERYQRGYRLRNVEQTQFITIGGSSHAHDPSTWYPFQKDANGAWLEDEFREEAHTDYPAMYRWNFSALNIFVTTGMSGGFCSKCTGRESDYIVTSPRQPALPPDFTAEEVFASHILHEIGHYVGLSHTHGALCGDQDTGICAATPVPIDGDSLDSTAPDIASLPGVCDCADTIDDLAQLNYGLNHSDLDQARRDLIDNSWFNLMSYHERHGFSVLTDEQLDWWADFARANRGPVVTGQTWFVDGAAGCANPFGTSSCVWGGPFPTVADGVEQANDAGGDIVLIRTGTYTDPGIINKAVTLRANRGSVVIWKE
jgi:hypothetical protein